MHGDDPPPRVEQVLRQPRRPLDRAGLRREGERQDRPAAPGDVRDRCVQPGQPHRTRVRHLLRRLQPLPRPLPGRHPHERHHRGAQAVAAPGPHGRDPLAGRDPAHRPAHHREGRPLGPEPGPEARPAAARGPLRRLDRRADRAALEPAPPPLGFPAPLEPPRPPDRLRHDPLRHPPDRRVPGAPHPQRLALVPRPAARRLDLLGLAALRAEWYARDIRKGLKVLNRDPSALRWELLWFKPTELGGQPLPTLSRGRAEERYELLRKFQGVLTTLGYGGIVVLIDRVDEPQQIEGDPRKMRALIWPLLDHKFLRHPGIGVKLLLPIELAYYLEKEDKEFYDRARPDKLNMIKPLRWTGPSLYDLASDRLKACRITPSANGQPVGDGTAPGPTAPGSAASSMTRSATTT